MMSGLEIVGLVLAIAPLLISALEDYKEINRKRDVFFKKSFYIGRLINALTEQQILVEGNVELLLGHAGFESKELEEIKAGRCLELLKEDDVRREVKAVLGESRYTAYFQTLRNCETTLFRIAREIGKFKQGPWVENGSLEDMLKVNDPQDAGHGFTKRWKFTMAKDDLEAAIKDLDSSTTMLSRLQRLGVSVNEQSIQSTSRRSTKMIRFLQNVRTGADSLYRAIASTWNHHCHDVHLVRLRLDNRFSALDSGKRKRLPNKSPAIDFAVIFEALSGVQGSFHHTSIIEVLDCDDMCPDPLIKTKITFQPPSNSPILTDLGDICQAISDAKMAQKVQKLYLHHDHRLQYSEELVTRTTSVSGDQERFISLDDLMHSSINGLSLKHRVLIAATVASSMMQLYSTPWLPHLRRETFYFQSKAVAGQTYERPVVCCSFTDRSCGVQYSRQAYTRELLDLGILIVELWRNKTIESFCAARNIPLHDTYDSRQSAARRWLNEEEGEFVPLIFEAAVRCVECRFSCVHFDLNNPDIQKLVYEGVVKPLWENCRL